jgi:hypothetical protein
MIPAHDFNQGYLSHRMPWEQGHANNADITGQSPVHVNGNENESVTHVPQGPSAPEAARRQAGQAESDAALARARAEAAVREAKEAAAAGDAPRAAQAAARAEQAAKEATEASARARAASDEALRATGLDPRAGLDYTLGGAPPAALGSLYHAENAQKSMDEAVRLATEARAIADRTQCQVSATRADTAGNAAQRAAQEAQATLPQQGWDPLRPPSLGTPPPVASRQEAPAVQSTVEATGQAARAAREAAEAARQMPGAVTLWDKRTAQNLLAQADAAAAQAAEAARKAADAAASVPVMSPVRARLDAAARAAKEAADAAAQAAASARTQLVNAGIDPAPPAQTGPTMAAG